MNEHEYSTNARGIYGVIHSFILYSVLQQVHNLFHSESGREY